MTRRDILSGLGTMAFMRQGSLGLSESARPISMIRLIANPSAFDRRRVRIAGYLEHNGLDRSVGLFLSEVDGRNRILSNSITLDKQSSTNLRRFMGKYILLNATFYAPTSEFDNGYLDQISGMIIIPLPE